MRLNQTAVTYEEPTHTPHNSTAPRGEVVSASVASPLTAVSSPPALSVHGDCWSDEETGQQTRLRVLRIGRPVSEGTASVSPTFA